MVNKIKIYNDTEFNILDSLLEEIKRETIENSIAIAPIISTGEFFNDDDIIAMDSLLDKPIIAKDLYKFQKLHNYQLVDILNVISIESEKYIKEGNFSNTNIFDKIFKYVEKITSKERIVNNIILNMSTTLSLLLEETPQNINDILKAIKDGKGKQLSAFIAAL
jgi:hypothetical protein